MTAKLPEPDLNYLQRVLLETLAIPSPTGFTDTIVRYVAERLSEVIYAELGAAVTGVLSH